MFTDQYATAASRLGRFMMPKQIVSVKLSGKIGIENTPEYLLKPGEIDYNPTERGNLYFFPLVHNGTLGHGRIIVKNTEYTVSSD